jgi:prepilin-type N-terminal cleavage/methylation domain-containing protein
MPHPLAIVGKSIPRPGEAGFSLIELIAVLVLVGIMGAGASLGLSNIVGGFMSSRDAAAIAGKGQLAMLRLAREFRVISAVSAATATAITFDALRDSGATQTMTVTQTGTTVTLNGDALTDKVTTLAMGYYDTFDGSPETSWAPSRRIIELVLTMDGPDNTPVVFSTRVMPRNL